MKIGLISDIHANLPALRAVFKSGEKCKVEHWLCMGDIVSYYYWPSECIQLLKEKSLDCIEGNHDRMLKQPKGKYFDDIFIKKYGTGSNYALSELSENQMNWLTSLPESLELSIEGFSILLCHGSPWNKDEYIYPDAKNEIFMRMNKLGFNFIFYGHTHYPLIKQKSNVTIVNPGSVGQPRDGVPGACWAIWDTNKCEFKLMRESYNYDEVISACKKFDPDNFYLQEVLKRNGK